MDKNKIRRDALKTIGYTNRDASWYVDNEVIPYYYDGCSDCIGDINSDRAVGHGIDAADIDYVESLTNCVVYAVSEEDEGDDKMPYTVFYIANIDKDDLGITNKNGITTDAVIAINYENGWVYTYAHAFASFTNFMTQGNEDILQFEEAEVIYPLADLRFKEEEEIMAES